MTDKCDICGKFYVFDGATICEACVPRANAECQAQTGVNPAD